MGKIKHFLESNKGKDIMVVVIMILMSLISFELGRLSKQSTNQGLKIDYTSSYEGQKGTNTSNISQNTELDDTASKSAKTDNFVASKKGTKFYGITCSAGKTIKEENKIYFNTADEAIRAGYEPSTACK